MKLIIKCIVAVILFYFISTCFRAYELNKTIRYTVNKQHESEPLIYPIKWHYDDIHRENRLASVDENGVYVTNYDKITNLTSVRGKQYNPVNIALMIIHEGKYYSEQKESYQYRDFLRLNLGWLVDNQDAQGRWYINFDNKISKRTNKAPWVSGLSQGLGISALIRGYYIFGDDVYLDAAKKAIYPMTTSIADGGVLSINEYGNIIEEYPFEQQNIHVLNGYLYSIIGIYELSLIDSSYQPMLDEHMGTLTKLLDRYTLFGGWSAYSLDEPTFRNHATYSNPMYHQLHIAQLSFLCNSSSYDQFCYTAEKFIEFKSSLASVFVHVSYIIFKDIIYTYKRLLYG
ncbi:D-glucuronyl C5-epimerase family protein [Colwellia sp. C1TZA3]|uniref:D-glucuronyl C5-epimerase family protein n=1 Tax=Colwellia sp. C1TZA3 TaxID=2508879 RepID=UPI00174A6778|nr:D-glucuronyl C5-epimerase family protein [Colwellia sp. C1TZA3]